MSTKPNPHRLNHAIAAAAQLVLGKISKAAGHPQATPRSLAHAILPAFGIDWNREVIDTVKRGEINKLLTKLRNSPLPRLHYDRLADLFKTAFLDPFSLIPEWAEWTQLSDTYLLGRRYPKEEIAQAITFLSARAYQVLVP